MNRRRIKRDLRRQNFFANTTDFDGKTVDCLWESFKLNLMKVINRHVPKINIKNRHSPPWIDADIVKASKKKHTAFKRAKEVDTQDAWLKFKKIRNKVKNIVANKYTNYINDLAANLSNNPKRFWGLSKK